MTPEEKYELFEKLCSNELSINEKARLHKLIDEDDAVKEELKVYQELHSHLDTKFTNEDQQKALTDNLKNIGDKYFAKKQEEKVIKEKVEKEIHKETHKKSKVIKMPSWAYAVAASAVIIFGVYFFNQNDPTYNDFASIPELSIVERGEVDKNIKRAESAFNTKNYPEAERYLSELLSKDSVNTKYQFYYGISLLEQNKYDKATAVFEKLYKGNSVYNYKALWFEALNQLKQKKYDQCAELLKKLPKEAEDYNQAIKLIKKLD